jgi:hypothetical protein
MRNTLTVGAVLLASALVAGCGAVDLPATGSPSPGTGQLQVASDSDSGRTFNLHVGDRLELKLSSTYWMVKGSSNPAVLRPEGAAVVSPQPSGCVPGGGCGTVEVIFDVVGTGSADVTASRNSCGEAMGCTENQGSYRVTVMATSA